MKKYSPDGKQFIVGSGFASGPTGSDLFSPVYLLDTQTGQKTGKLLHKNCVVIEGVDYHPTDNNLVLTSCDNHLYLWRINQPGKSELSTSKKEFEQDFVQSTSIQTARFCPDGSCVIAYLYSGRTAVWDIHSATKPMSVIDSYFAGSWDGCAEQKSGVLIGRKNPNGQYPVHINFVLSTNSYLNDGLLSMDNHMNWMLHVDSDYRKQPALVCETQFSTDETRLVTRDAKGSVRVMNQADNHVISELKHPTKIGATSVPNMALSSNGKWLATITPDWKAVKIWDTDTGQLLATIWGSPQFVTFIPNTDEFSISESDWHTLYWKVSTLSSATSLQVRILF